MKAVVVGAGIAGCCSARILHDAGWDVHVIERKGHIGGNVYDYYRSGVMVHKYGPHIYHTDSDEAYSFMNKYADFYDYRHVLMGYIDNKHVPLPPNINTIEALGLENTLSGDCDIEEIMGDKLGDTIYEKVFRRYNHKQWGGTPPDKKIYSRFKIFNDRDDRVHRHRYSGLPREGRTRTFEKMLEGIEVSLNSGYGFMGEDILIRTGSIDEYFHYEHGKLEYNCTRFDMVDGSELPCGSVTYPSLDYEYTRASDFGKMSETEIHGPTVTCYEYPRKGNIPCYPLENRKNLSILNVYKECAKEKKDVIFLGRLGSYKYMDMDHVVLQVINKLGELL